jgi:hypothetical protein
MWGISVAEFVQATQPASLDGCPMFAPAYMGRKWNISNAFPGSASDSLVEVAKTLVGFARLFRPK